MKFQSDIEELVYLEYQDIDASAYQERIHFFERNRKAIGTLQYEFRLEMSLEYVVALFEVGDYYRYLKHVDRLLTKVIEENIFSVNDDDIYQELLYRKAASLHNIVDYYGAEHVLSELNRIQPDNDIYKRTFLKNSIDSLRYQGQRIRGGIIGMFLVAGVIIGTELLVIRPFYPEQVAYVEYCRNFVFGAAVLGIIIQQLRIRFISFSKLRKLNKK